MRWTQEAIRVPSARPPLFGLEMFRRLRDSRIALNTHIDISSASASNMRLFEALVREAKEYRASRSRARSPVAAGRW